eukprot:9470984-Pyramimonas_sp.AAC.1
MGTAVDSCRWLLAFSTQLAALRVRLRVKRAARRCARRARALSRAVAAALPAVGQSPRWLRS